MAGSEKMDTVMLLILLYLSRVESKLFYAATAHNPEPLARIHGDTNRYSIF
jgi:hypothetical protein